MISPECGEEEDRLAREKRSDHTDDLFIESAPELALALANRSACLRKIGAFELALEDIRLAFIYGYPKDRYYKLLDRRARCLQSLGRTCEARAAFSEALNSATDLNLSTDEARQFVGGLKDAMKQLHNEKPKKFAKDKDKGLHNVLEIVGPRHSRFNFAADCLELVHSPERGRHLVATRDIDIGETLLYEEPVAFWLDGDRHGTHCQHCFTLVKAAVPCIWCVEVNFCSVACRYCGVVTCRWRDMLFHNHLTCLITHKRGSLNRHTEVTNRHFLLQRRGHIYLPPPRVSPGQAASLVGHQHQLHVSFQANH